MYAFTIASILAAAGTAYSVAFRQTEAPPSYGVSLQVCGYDSNHPKACGLTSAEINKLLIAVDGVESSLTSIRFAGNAWNVDLFAVQCRAYGNKEGTIPVGVPFNTTYDLDLGEKPVGV